MLIVVDVDDERAQNPLKLVRDFLLQQLRLSLAKIAGDVVVRVEPGSRTQKPTSDPLRKRHALAQLHAVAYVLRY